MGQEKRKWDEAKEKETEGETEWNREEGTKGKVKPQWRLDSEKEKRYKVKGRE